MWFQKLSGTGDYFSGRFGVPGELRAQGARGGSSPSASRPRLVFHIVREWALAAAPTGIPGDGREAAEGKLTHNVEY